MEKFGSSIFFGTYQKILWLEKSLVYFMMMKMKKGGEYQTMTQLTHFDKQGASRMVDVGKKEVTDRVAVADAKIIMRPETFRLIMDKKIQKGDVLEVARVAGIMAAKQTFTLIPMCHPLNLTSVKIDYTNNSVNEIDVLSEVRVTGKTGVEMEPIPAAAVLCHYDI